MKKSLYKTRWLWLSLLCLLVLPSASWGADDWNFLDRVPGDLRSTAGPAPAPGLRYPSLARGEAEGIPIRLIKGEEGSLPVRVWMESGPIVDGGPLEIEFFRIERIRGTDSLGIEHEFPDVLLPPNGTSTPEDGSRVFDLGTVAAGTHYLWLKITSKSDAIPGTRKLHVKLGDDPDAKLLPVEVTDLVLPSGVEVPVTVMANISVMGSGEERVARARELLELLSRYRINGASGILPEQGIMSTDETKPVNVFKFADLVETAFNEWGYKEIRLPKYTPSDCPPYDAQSPPFYDPGANPPSVCVGCTLDGDYPAWDACVQKVADDYLKVVLKEALARNVGWGGRFSYKWLDEPKVEEYPFVKCIYSNFHDKLGPLEEWLRTELAGQIASQGKDLDLDFKLEVTEQPCDDGCDSLDDQPWPFVKVWTLNYKCLREKNVDTGKNSGAQVRFYANTWHGLRTELYGASMSMAPRMIGWLMWYYGLDGYYLMDVNQDPLDWTSAPWSEGKEDDLGRYLNKNFVFTASISGTTRMVPTLRLEALRDGIEDLLILKVIENRVAENGTDKERPRAEFLAGMREEVRKFHETAADLGQDCCDNDRLDSSKESPPDMSYRHDALREFKWMEKLRDPPVGTLTPLDGKDLGVEPDPPPGVMVEITAEGKKEQ